MDAEQISYSQTYEELQKILEGVREKNIDVDNLSEKVKKARELIKICEGRIKKAEVEIEEIVKASPENSKK